MVIAVASLVARSLKFLPAPLLRALDRWSYAIALRRREARRHAGDRPVAPLPPVVVGHAVPPHPWNG